jgi:acyl-CoA thioesterase FadM
MGAPLRLGPFAVRTEEAEVEAFARATGGTVGRIPFTFPVRWFARPELRATVAEMMDEADWVPIHESQSFDYRRPLDIDSDYRMRVEMWREQKPARLILRAEIATGEDELCLSMEMILRVVSVGGPDQLSGSIKE